MNLRTRCKVSVREKERKRDSACNKEHALSVKLYMLVRKKWKRESGVNETDRECQNIRKRECQKEKREWKV